MDQHPAVKSARMECGRELGSFLPRQATPRLSPEGERESAEGMKGGPSGRHPEGSHPLRSRMGVL